MYGSSEDFLRIGHKTVRARSSLVKTVTTRENGNECRRRKTQTVYLSFFVFPKTNIAHRSPRKTVQKKSFFCIKKRKKSYRHSSILPNGIINIQLCCFLSVNLIKNGGWGALLLFIFRYLSIQVGSQTCRDRAGWQPRPIFRGTQFQDFL